MCVSQFHFSLLTLAPVCSLHFAPLPASCGNTKPDSAHPPRKAAAGLVCTPWDDEMVWDFLSDRLIYFFFPFFFWLCCLLPSLPFSPPPPKPQPPNRIPFNFVRSAPYSLFFFLSDTTGRIFLLAAAADHVGTVGSFFVCFLGAV